MPYEPGTKIDANPCPFCGGAETYITEHKGVGKWGVWCHSCYATGPMLSSRELAILAWNARAPVQQGRATVTFVPDNPGESFDMFSKHCVLHKRHPDYPEPMCVPTTESRYIHPCREQNCPRKRQ